MLSSSGLSCSRLNALRLCTHVPWSFFFLSFSKIFILAYYRDLKRIFRSPRSVIVDHCRSFLVLVTTREWLPAGGWKKGNLVWSFSSPTPLRGKTLIQSSNDRGILRSLTYRTWKLGQTNLCSFISLQQTPQVGHRYDHCNEWGC